MIAIEIRACRRADLPELEWGGTYACDRPLFRHVLALADAGAMAMLVAEHAGQHVGQLWIDLVRGGDVAILWALRVRPAWRGRGAGTQLVAAGEHVAMRAGRAWAEIEVEPPNTRARALYERLGYRWVRRAPARDAITGALLPFELDVLRRRLGGA